MLSTLNKVWHFGLDTEKKAKKYVAVALPSISRPHDSKFPTFIYPSAMIFGVSVFAFAFNHKKTIVDVAGVRIVSAAVNDVPKTAIGIILSASIGYAVVNNIAKRNLRGADLVRGTKTVQVRLEDENGNWIRQPNNNTTDDGEDTQDNHTYVNGFAVENRQVQTIAPSKNDLQSIWYKLSNEFLSAAAYTGLYCIQTQVAGTLISLLTNGINAATFHKIPGIAQALSTGLVKGVQKKSAQAAIKQINYANDVAILTASPALSITGRGVDTHYLADNIQWWRTFREDMLPGILASVIVNLARFSAPHFKIQNVYLRVVFNNTSNCFFEVLETVIKRIADKGINGGEFKLTARDIMKDCASSILYDVAYNNIAPRFNINPNQPIGKAMLKQWGRDSIINGTIEVALQSFESGTKTFGPRALNADFIPGWNDIRSKSARKPVRQSSTTQGAGDEMPSVDPVHPNAVNNGPHTQGVNNRRNSDDVGRVQNF